MVKQEEHYINDFNGKKLYIRFIKDGWVYYTVIAKSGDWFLANKPETEFNKMLKSTSSGNWVKC